MTSRTTTKTNKLKKLFYTYIIHIRCMWKNKFTRWQTRETAYTNWQLKYSPRTVAGWPKRERSRKKKKRKARRRLGVYTVSRMSWRLVPEFHNCWTIFFVFFFTSFLFLHESSFPRSGSFFPSILASFQ